jgi:hypothetical protein
MQTKFDKEEEDFRAERIHNSRKLEMADFVKARYENIEMRLPQFLCNVWFKNCTKLIVEDVDGKQRDTFYDGI